MLKPFEPIVSVAGGHGQVLDRLAAALGGSANSLFGASAQPSESRDTHELLSLWLSLRNDKTRAQVLAGIRAAVAAQSESENAVL